MAMQQDMIDNGVTNLERLLEHGSHAVHRLRVGVPLALLSAGIQDSCSPASMLQTVKCL